MKTRYLTAGALAALMAVPAMADDLVLSIGSRGYGPAVERNLATLAETNPDIEVEWNKVSDVPGETRKLYVTSLTARSPTPDVFALDVIWAGEFAQRGWLEPLGGTLHQRLNVTSIYVTHDQVEAMTLADRIVIMNGGVVAQVGTPREVYERPADEFVAGFIGSPAMNFVDLARDDSGAWHSSCGGITLPHLAFETGARRAIRMGVRPEHIDIVAPGAAPPAIAFEAAVYLDELLGADALVNVRVRDVPLLVRTTGTSYPVKGERVRIAFDPARLHAFDPGTGAALAHSDGA